MEPMGTLLQQCILKRKIIVWYFSLGHGAKNVFVRTITTYVNCIGLVFNRFEDEFM